MSQNKIWSLSLPRTIALLVHYFIGYLFLYRIIASYLSLFIEPSTKIILPWIQIASYLFTVGMAILLAWPAITDSYRRFKEKKKDCMKWIGTLVVIMLVANIVLSMLVSLLTMTDNSANQQEIVQSAALLPIITLLSTCIFSPIIEELVFRAGTFTFLRGKWGFVVATIISSILFGFIHILDSLLAGNFLDLSYLLVYSTIGVVLAYGYEKTESVFVTIGIHMLNNIFSILIMYL